MTEARAIFLTVALAQARLAATDDRLRPVGHLELAKNVRDVIAHRFGTEHQFIGDIAVAGPLRDEIEYLTLSGAQLRKCLRWDSRPGRGEEVHQSHRDGRAEDRLAISHRA